MTYPNEIDLDVALKTLHELASNDGDLGRDYWNSVSKLLREAATLRASNIELLNELRSCRHELEVWARPRVKMVISRHRH